MSCLTYPVRWHGIFTDVSSAYCTPMQNLCGVVCDLKACNSMGLIRHKHWLCWMSTGKKKGCEGHTLHIVPLTLRAKYYQVPGTLYTSKFRVGKCEVFAKAGCLHASTNFKVERCSTRGGRAGRDGRREAGKDRGRVGAAIAVGFHKLGGLEQSIHRTSHLIKPCSPVLATNYY